MGDGKIHLKKIKNNDSVKENDCKKFTQKQKHRKLQCYTVIFPCSNGSWVTVVAYRSGQEHRLKTGVLLMKKGWEINGIPGWWGWWITLNVGIQGSCIYHTALSLTPQKNNDGQKDFHWVIFHDTQTQTHHALEGRKAFFNGPPQNHSPELPPFHIKQNCCFFPSSLEFILQIRAKKSFCPGLLNTLYMFACPHK